MNNEQQIKVQILVSKVDNLENKIRTNIVVGQEDEYVMGRSQSHADIVINDPNASRMHFSIKSKYNKVWIEDLQTKNGTFLNGQKVSSALLNVGDVILLGNHIISISNIQNLSEEVKETNYIASEIIEPSMKYEIIRALS